MKIIQASFLAFFLLFSAVLADDQSQASTQTSGLFEDLVHANKQINTQESSDNTISYVDGPDVQFASDASDAPIGMQGREYLFPLSTREIYGFVLTMLFAGLANAGGLGGGTLLTPLLIMVFSYSADRAIDMVYVLVFGGSVGNFLNVAFKRDHKTRKPLVDYNLGLICMPLMLLGVTIGVFLNRIFPPLITLMGLMASIAYCLIRMYSKVRKQFADETKEKRRKASLVLNAGLETAGETTGGRTTCYESEVLEYERKADPKLDALLRDEYALRPMKKLVTTLVLIAIIIFLAVLRGSQNFNSIIGIPYCGVGYWALTVLTIVFCFIALLINLRTLREPIKIKKVYNIVTVPGRFELSDNNSVKLIILALIAGIMAGLLGIGGGMIMGPTLISIGVPAQTLAATCGFFIVQTSFISVVQSILYGNLPLKDQGVFLVLSVVGSFGVSYLLTALVKKYNRPSLVLVVVLAVLCLALIGTPTFEIATQRSEFGQMLQFGSIC